MPILPAFGDFSVLTIGRGLSLFSTILISGAYSVNQPAGPVF
jgi:hypothetical protein